MKQVTISVNEAKFPFFMELINSFDFIKIEQEEGDSKEAIANNIKQGLRELKDIEEGKTSPKITLKEFLNEL